MLSDVIAAVTARLAAAGVTAPVLVGKRHVKQHGTGTNRIVVVPSDDSYGAGATQDFNGGVSGARQRPLITRKCGAEVHVWGVAPDPKAPTADLLALSAAEALLHDFIRELRHEVRGQWSVGNGTWTNDTKDVVYGAEYVFSIVVDVPVVDVLRPALPQGAAITTTASMGPSSSEVVS